MAKTKIEKIASIQEKIKHLQNQEKEIIQQQKIQDRKDRTKRLCSRMGLFESMLPDTISLTEEQFKTFLEKTIITEHSRRILDGLTAQNAVITTQETAKIDLPDNHIYDDKSSQMVLENGTSERANKDDSTRVLG